jgi:phosphate transport system substrate-binding protein
MATKTEEKTATDKLAAARNKNLDLALESITAAMATAQIPDDFRFSITNAPGENAYPIAGATWLLVYQQQKDATKGKKLVEFLKWAQKDGEKMAKDLDYAPLPEELQQRVLKRSDEIKM